MVTFTFEYFLNVAVLSISSILQIGILLSLSILSISQIIWSLSHFSISQIRFSLLFSCPEQLNRTHSCGVFRFGVPGRLLHNQLRIYKERERSLNCRSYVNYIYELPILCQLYMNAAQIYKVIILKLMREKAAKK